MTDYFFLTTTANSPLAIALKSDRQDGWPAVGPDGGQVLNRSANASSTAHSSAGSSNDLRMNFIDMLHLLSFVDFLLSVNNYDMTLVYIDPTANRADFAAVLVSHDVAVIASTESSDNNLLANAVGFNSHFVTNFYLFTVYVHYPVPFVLLYFLTSYSILLI
jgi:hypothetical protein